MKLKFKGGKFKIHIFADIHGAEKELKWTFRHIETAIEKTEPDFVVLLGDNITGNYKGITVEKVKTAIEKIGSIFEKRNIPFALVFGNHDHEGLCKLGFDERSAKKFILNEFQKFSTCLATEGEEMTGVGNYNIPLFSEKEDKSVFNLWFKDSNSYADEREGGGYGYVHTDQIEWYERRSKVLKGENGGENLPSFLFQHIIVPEIYDILEQHDIKVKGSVKGHGSHSDKFYTPNKEFIKNGSLKEGPCPPDVKSAQFDSWQKTGDIVAAFFGHDHVNDFSAEYKGIDIHQVPSAGFFSYGNNRGSRIVTLYENNPRAYETEIIHIDDVCKIKLIKPFIKNHGYQEYRNIYAPILFGSTSVIVVGGLIKLIKKYK